MNPSFIVAGITNIAANTLSSTPSSCCKGLKASHRREAAV